MKHVSAVAVLLLALTLDLSITEFAELQGLSDEDRRARLGLPAGCRPSLAAIRPSGATNRVIVLVECKPVTTVTTVPVPQAALPLTPSLLSATRESNVERHRPGRWLESGTDDD